MKKAKKIVTMILVITMLAGLAACSSKTESKTENPETEKMSDTMKKIKKSGKIVVGTEASFPPLEFHKEIDGKDTITGFDIFVAEEIAKDLGVELEIKDMSFDGLLAALVAGNVDFVAAGMAATEERRQSVDFSIRYYDTLQTILARDDNKDEFPADSDMKGKLIGVQKGSTQSEIMSRMYPKAKTVEIAKNADIILQLQSGKIDGALLDDPIAQLYASANPGLTATELTFKNDPEYDVGSSIAVSKEAPDVLESIDKTLQRIMDDGTYDKLLEKADSMLDADMIDMLVDE